MNEKDFKIATECDRKQYVVRPYEQIPLTELVEGSFSHLVNTENLTVSFLTMKANSFFDVHTHENEQLSLMVIVMKLLMVEFIGLVKEMLFICPLMCLMVHLFAM